MEKCINSERPFMLILIEIFIVTYIQIYSDTYLDMSRFFICIDFIKINRVNLLNI